MITRNTSTIQQTLRIVHQHLTDKNFPYSDISVVHRHQDLGFHVFILKSSEKFLTDEIISYLHGNDFTYSII